MRVIPRVAQNGSGTAARRDGVRTDPAGALAAAIDAVGAARRNGVIRVALRRIAGARNHATGRYGAVACSDPSLLVCYCR